MTGCKSWGVLCLCGVLMNGFMAVGQMRKVAVVTGNYSREYANLAASDQWKAERFLSRDLALLAPRLKEFDLVINGTTSGDKMPCDWKGIAPQVKEYLEDGGLLLLVTACTPVALHGVIHHFGPEFNVTYSACSVHKDQQKITRRVWDQSLGVNVFPQDLDQAFSNEGMWLHLNVPKGDSGWQVMAECCDKHPVMMFHPMGLGGIVVTTYFDFHPARRVPSHALLENLLALVSMRKAGVRLTGYTLGRDFGPGQCKLSLEAMDGGQKSLVARMTQKGTSLAKAACSWEGTETQKVQLDYDVAGVEALELTLELGSSRGTEVIHIRRSVRKPFVFLPWREDVYPLIAGSFPVEVRLAPVFRSSSDHAMRFSCKGSVIAHQRKNDKLCLLDLGKLSPGEHQIKAELVNQKTGACEFSAVENLLVLKRNPRYCVGLDGCMRRGQEKIFPLGFYLVIYKLPDHARTASVDFLHELQSDVYLVTQMRLPWKPDPGFADFMSYAEKKGVDVVIDPVPPKAYSPIVGYTLVDEPDSRPVNYPNLHEERRKIRREKPNLFSSVVLMGHNGFTDVHLRMADMVGHDPYPIPKNSITSVYYGIRDLVDKLDSSSHLPFCVPQAFGYPNHPFYVLPSVGEIRNMIWQAIAAGAKGLFFYTFMDNGFDMRKHPEFRAEVVKAVKTIRRLQPFLLNGTRKMVITKVKDVFQTRWSWGGKRLVVTVNGSREPQRLDGMPLKPLEVLLQTEEIQGD